MRQRAIPNYAHRTALAYLIIVYLFIVPAWSKTHFRMSDNFVPFLRAELVITLGANLGPTYM